MKQYRQVNEYSVLEINGILETLSAEYDIVRIVDVEECRILEVQPDGSIQYGSSCYKVWNRNTRCANCSSYRACMTHCDVDKTELLGHNVERIHSIPIYLELLSGDLEMCVLECVKFAGVDQEHEQDSSTDSDGYISTFDVLTRLYTQEKLFREIRLRLLAEPEEPYLLVLGNIRNFRLVNKLYGIEGGNRVLVGIADILRSECTQEEIYGRYRDDRFAMLIKKSKFHEQLFADRLQKVRELVNSPIFTIQIKLGVFEISDKNMPLATMLEHADLAVDSIRNSKDTLIAHYEPGMMTRKKEELNIITDFEVALAEEQFKIYLQPQVRDDGLVVGAEALVRWERPGTGMLLPAQFLHVLHQSELLSHLDMYIWEKTVQLLRRWQGTQMERLYLSINVDPTDFYYLDVPATLIDLCRRYGVSPSRLRVEITETALFEDMEKQNKMVETLHSMGFLVEIDDFGKGFSSLSLLKDINADVLKIDMGFIQGVTDRQRSRVILKSVIGMADNLHMGVITEGVETHDQVERLIGIGCHNFQGFYYSRPIPVEDFEEAYRLNLQEKEREM